MDSQHRREVEENELLEFWHAFQGWWKDNGTQTLLLIAVAALTFTGVRWYQTKDINELNTAYLELEQASSPESTINVAENYSHRPKLVSLALLKAGDMYLNNSTIGMGATADNDTRKAEVQNAIKQYQQVIDLNATPLVVLNARDGLAKAYETLAYLSGYDQELFAKAKEQYTKMQELAASSKGYELGQEISKYHQENFDSRTHEIVFPKAPEIKLPDVSGGSDDKAPDANGEANTPETSDDATKPADAEGTPPANDNQDDANKTPEPKPDPSSTDNK